jgi:hypothetical protein
MAGNGVVLLPNDYSTATACGPSKRIGTSVKIIANVDVGFGNRLYIRGDGCGLSWDRGVEMQSIDDDHWSWASPRYGERQCFDFKLLINDETWSAGENYVAIGELNEVAPSF